MPGRAKFIFTNYDYSDTGSWSHYGMDHLHKSGWSMVLSSTLVCFAKLSDMTLLLSAIFVLLLTSISLFVSFRSSVLPCKCKGTREYVRKPPPLLLARETAGVRECSTLNGVGCLGKCALVAGDCRVIAGLV